MSEPAITAPGRNSSLIIVGAAVDGESGEKALAKLLNAVEGTFAFSKSPAHIDRTIHAQSNISLLLDLLRVKDEESAPR